MKIFISLLLAAIVATGVTLGQTVVLSESFDTAFPVQWSQQSQEEVQWKYQPSLGTYGTGCAIADQSQHSDKRSGLLQTPFIDITTVSNPVISFKTALVQNNFVAPNVSLWYDIGSGWQLLHRWGSTNYGADVDIEQTQDVRPPLNGESVHWVDISYDIPSLVSNKHIRFAFGADFVNGGWVLVDKVVVSGDVFTDVAEQGGGGEMSLRVYPNPTAGMLYVESPVSMWSVEIVDAQGQKVYSAVTPTATGTKIEIDIRALAKGVYFLQSRTSANSTQTAVKKFVVL